MNPSSNDHCFRKQYYRLEKLNCTSVHVPGAYLNCVYRVVRVTHNKKISTNFDLMCFIVELLLSDIHKNTHMHDEVII